MKLAGALWKFFGIVVAFFAYIFLLAFISGGTLAIMWNWFIAPLGTPHIELWWAMGISCLVGFLRYNPEDTEAQKIKQAKGIEAVIGLLFTALWNKFTLCALTLIFGLIFHGLMS